MERGGFEPPTYRGASGLRPGAFAISATSPNSAFSVNKALVLLLRRTTGPAERVGRRDAVTLPRLGPFEPRGSMPSSPIMEVQGVEP